MVDGFMSWLEQLQWGRLVDMVITVCSAVLCITIHETSHGLAAWALGDPTAKRAGRLTLNPLKHIDFLGLVMMAVARFGWAKPVPVNMYRFKNPKAGMALTALAGPVSNVALTWAAMMCYYVTAFYGYLYDSAVIGCLQTFFLYTALLSAGLAVFNLFPIPPLDGSKVLFSLIPNTWYNKLMRYERYGMILLGALLLMNVLDGPLSAAQYGLIGLLEPISRWPFELLYRIYF